MEAKSVYFEKPGIENTETVLKLVKERAAQLGIKTVVLASTTGYTAVKAVEILKGFKIIAVTLATGAHRPDDQPFKVENRKIVEAKGGIILTATQPFSGLDRALHLEINPIPTHYTSGDLVSTTFRIFSQGMKVATEIAAMATDAGLVRTDEDIISIGGTSRSRGGADTAIVIQPSNVRRFFNTKVKEIICKPRL